MRVSICHHKKMIYHGITGLLICSSCGNYCPTIQLKDIKNKQSFRTKTSITRHKLGLFY
jgi:hypothetical protein